MLSIFYGSCNELLQIYFDQIKEFKKIDLMNSKVILTY